MDYKSVLFVPGHEEKKIQKAYTLKSSLVVLDLESTVPDNKKNIAKEIIKNFSVDKTKTFIRINDESDLNFVAEEKFKGIFLPFTETRKQLENISNMLSSIEKIQTEIIPIMESINGLANLKEICNYGDRVKVVSFGSHDLAKSINLNISPDEKEILEFRKNIVNHSSNIEKPIDTSYLDFRNLKGFEKSCNLVKQLGFGGKACIHPDQVEISNKIF